MYSTCLKFCLNKLENSYVAKSFSIYIEIELFPVILQRY